MRLWRAVEGIPGLTAVRDEWRRFLGEDSAWVEQNLLRPTGELATVYPSNHGEPYRIVDHGAGRYRAVHPDGEPPLELTKADVTILHLDIAKLARLLCQAFGFEARDVDQAAGDGNYRIGRWSATPRTACSVWLCVPADSSDLHDALRQLATEADGPLAVLTAAANVDASLARLLANRLACHVPLAEAIQGGEASAFAVSPAGDRILAAFRRSVRVAELAAVAGEASVLLHADNTSTRPAGDGCATVVAEREPRDAIEDPARQPDTATSKGPTLDDDRMTVTYAGVTCRFPPRRSLLFRLLKRIIRRPGQRVSFAALCDHDGPWDGYSVDDSTIRGAVARLRAYLRESGLEAVAGCISTMTDGPRGYVLFDPSKLDSSDAETEMCMEPRP